MHDGKFACPSVWEVFLLESMVQQEYLWHAATLRESFFAS